MDRILFFDTETNIDGDKLLDIGAVKDDKTELHTTSRSRFIDFIHPC